MKRLIFVVGLYFIVKAGIDAFRVVEHFSAYTFSTAYAAGFATGQIVAPVLFFVVGVLLIRHCWSAGSLATKQVPVV